MYDSNPSRRFFAQDKIRIKKMLWWCMTKIVIFASKFVFSFINCVLPSSNFLCLCLCRFGLIFNIRFCNIWENYRRHLGFSNRLSFLGKARHKKFFFCKIDLETFFFFLGGCKNQSQSLFWIHQPSQLDHHSWSLLPSSSRFYRFYHLCWIW